MPEATKIANMPTALREHKISPGVWFTGAATTGGFAVTIWAVYALATMPPAAVVILSVFSGASAICLLAAGREYYIREGIRLAMQSDRDENEQLIDTIAKLQPRDIPIERRTRIGQRLNETLARVDIKGQQVIAGWDLFVLPLSNAPDSQHFAEVIAETLSPYFQLRRPENADELARTYALRNTQGIVLLMPTMPSSLGPKFLDARKKSIQSIIDSFAAEGVEIMRGEECSWSMAITLLVGRRP